jgi:hypothetical protein
MRSGAASFTDRAIRAGAWPRPRLRREAAREFFDGLWADSDPWELDTSDLDERRCARQVELLADRRYARALEIGERAALALVAQRDKEVAG